MFFNQTKKIVRTLCEKSYLVIDIKAMYFYITVTKQND